MAQMHYWRGWCSLNESFIATVRAFIDYSGVIIEGADGEGAPVLTAEGEIALNGSRLLGERDGSFLLVHGVNHRNWVHTGQLPYDVVVCATLLLATARNKGFKVESSAGHWDDTQWRAARHLYTVVTGMAPVQPEGLGGPAARYREYAYHGVRSNDTV